MVDIIDDTMPVTIEVIQKGEAFFSNVIFDTPVEYGGTSDLTYDVTNDGAPDRLWAGLWDNTNNRWEIAPWYEDFNAGEKKSFGVYTIGPLTENFDGILRAGHVE